MNNFITYSIEVAICLTLFYSVYWIFLKKETYFKLNRFYLNSTLLISILLPLLNITIVTNGNESSFWTKYIAVPVESYENKIDANIHHKYLSKDHNSTWEAMELNADNSNASTEQNEISKSNSGISTQKTVSDNNINWLAITLTVYIVGAALFFIRFLANFIWIFRYIFRYKHQFVSGLKVIQIEKNTSPFSFFNFVFLNKKEYPEDELSKIITHEKVHFLQKHSIDLILFELLFIFQWFNPIVWMYKRAIKITHEYLADLGTLNAGVDPQGYQYSLINEALLTYNLEITSSYNYSIKNRISMMAKKRSSKLSMLKLTLALPILLVLFSAFAFNCNSGKKNDSQKENNNVAFHDSTIKKVDVPVDYLKGIEGEYVSTNDPRGIRRIVFTELFGELLAYDNGYSYRPVFVGDGKFINPDDNATLVFDTKNKEKISLLLFGCINLDKVRSGKESNTVQNRSLAYSTAKVILNEGVSTGLAFYNKAKDSSNYYLMEDEMNYAGYQMLERKKAKEAVAIFKLNTEKFPSSFNTFDSYAEALLAIGEKNQAIEQFKRSLQLNPGSRNGLKRLKELGVDPGSVVKLPQIKLEDLQLLEGVYLSTNQPNFMRKITFAIIDGALSGEDNGYRYKLIAMGDGKFINPDDGATLLFDTKEKDAISLLLFGKINLKKVKVTKEPLLSLKEYAGVYLPAKKDTMLLPMEILNSQNKLFRFIENPNDYTVNRNIELEFVTGNLFYYPDRSYRSIEFVVNTNQEVTGCILRRPDGTYNLTKKK